MRGHELELAWAAGVYEGGGSVTLNRGRPAIQIRHNDPEPLQRFAAAVNVGRVYGPYWDAKRHGKRRPFFFFIASGVPAIDAAMSIAPNLSRRRLVAQISDMLAGVRGAGSFRADEAYDVVRRLRARMTPE